MADTRLRRGVEPQGSLEVQILPPALANQEEDWMILASEPEHSLQSCHCTTCQGLCATGPGWFLPGEAEKVAEFLEISLKELFETKLTADYWVKDPPIYILSPAFEGMGPAGETATGLWPQGRCVFLKENGLCEIHPVKPYECRIALGCGQGKEKDLTHEEIAEKWKPHQAQVKQLLKHTEP